MKLKKKKGNKKGSKIKQISIKRQGTKCDIRINKKIKC